MRPAGLACICIVLLLASACRKKEASPSPEESPVPVQPVPAKDSNFICQALPPTPAPFGWTDSTYDVQQNIVAFIYDPVLPDRVVYIAQGDVGAYNLIRSLNLVNGSVADLGNAGQFLPSVNQSGWMLYSTADYNIVRVKCNGDSMSLLMGNNLHLAPHWDYSGKNFYYFFNATQSIASQIMKVSADGGTVLNAFFADLPHMACYNKEDKIIYMKTAAAEVTLVERDMLTSKERDLVKGPYNSKTGQVHFNHLCVDREDKNMYWSNNRGIFRCNLASLKIDTVRANCENFTVDGPMISFRPNELTFSKHEMKALSPLVLYHKFRAVEMDLVTGKTRITRFFD